MATYVLVHGSFWGSWCWKDVVRLLRAAGHDAYAPSLTGIGERIHLASPEITLDTHILDVCGTLTYEELRDVVLVGWSYGGMVITGVAERMPGRIAHLVFLDAKDDKGRSVESEGFAKEFEEPPGRSTDYWPYLLNLRVPPGARELNLVLAVTQSRFAEFLAKPEQASANSGL